VRRRSERPGRGNGEHGGRAQELAGDSDCTGRETARLKYCHLRPASHARRTATKRLLDIGGPVSSCRSLYDTQTKQKLELPNGAMNDFTKSGSKMCTFLSISLQTSERPPQKQILISPICDNCSSVDSDCGRRRNLEFVRSKTHWPSASKTTSLDASGSEAIRCNS